MGRCLSLQYDGRGLLLSGSSCTSFADNLCNWVHQDASRMAAILIPMLYHDGGAGARLRMGMEQDGHLPKRMRPCFRRPSSSCSLAIQVEPASGIHACCMLCKCPVLCAEPVSQHCTPQASISSASSQMRVHMGRLQEEFSAPASSASESLPLCSASHGDVMPSSRSRA